MADSLVIVAIPDENDRVWKVSSEKVPHLTLLYLGEDVTQVAHVDQIVSFVEHAASTMLRRFNLSVDRRGELGADQADVIFFKKNHYDYKALWDFRAALLQDANIKTAYDSTAQFEGPWYPHLTLGYPAAPAQDETDDQGFYNVMFNKIAVWVTADDGPDFLLKDYWDEMGDMLETVPMDVAMSSLNHATKVSDTPWSNFKTSDYTDEQYARACLLDRGAEVEGKQRYAIPVREPDGALNRNGCHAAAAVLSSKGGTGSARGNKVKATPEQLAAAKRKLVALYNGPLNEDVPEGLKETMKQAIEFGTEFVLEHYGKKGMKWGVRNAPGSNPSGAGETKREGLQRFLDPQGHKLGSDVAKSVIGIVVPVVAPLTWPANIRMVRGGARGIKAKALDRQEKKFAKKAMSPKNFAAIHNGALDKINRDIGGLNQKYPAPNKSPATQKKYDSEVLKSMQDGYKASANSLTNKAQTMHLDVEFHGDGNDFKIHARQGAPTPLPQRVKHAVEDVTDEEITIEITGKLQRDVVGHIVGFVFDHLDEKSVEHTIDVGAEFVLEHYGVKGMRWGTRRASAVTTQQHIDTGLLRRRTKIVAKGGAAAPAHTDAVTAAVQKQVVKKSGTDALSTTQLRDLANRLQVENQVQILLSSKGKQFVRGELEREGKSALKKGATTAAPHVLKKARRTAATVATTAVLL